MTKYHIFIINGIINDVINNKETEEINIEIYDIAKCFDKLEYFNTANDLFKVGVNDDKFIVVADSNMESNVAIKTPWGTKTERMKLNNVEMQCSRWPKMCYQYRRNWQRSS